MGTRTPSLSSSSTMRGTAAAASSLLTVTRTSSDPARASAAHCWTVEGMSAVSVLVMDCTTTGASEPTRTPPTTAVTVFLRGMIAMGASILARGNTGALVKYRVSGTAKSASAEQFAVRAHANKLQNLSIRFAVDKQQIGPEVAFAVVLPIAGQPVVAVLFGEDLVLS